MVKRQSLTVFHVSALFYISGKYCQVLDHILAVTANLKLHTDILTSHENPGNKFHLFFLLLPHDLRHLPVGVLTDHRANLG